MSAARAAIVTGASSGIGLAIARVLGEEGYGSRRRAAAGEARGGRRGLAARRASRCSRSPPTSPTRPRSRRSSTPTASATAASTCSSTTPASASARPWARSRPSTSTCSSTSTCARSSSSTANACRCSARPRAEHNNALVVNTSSISGKRGEGWLSVYSATKHGVVGWTEAMNKELGGEGIKSTALCPAFVDTPMTDFVKEHVPADEMIRPEDIAESVRYLLQRLPRLRRAGDHVRAPRRGALADAWRRTERCARRAVRRSGRRAGGLAPPALRRGRSPSERVRRSCGRRRRLA